jgi:predicted cytidylate kinase
MIIAIAGLTGSGKNTLGELLAEELEFKLVSPTFKDLAKKEGIPLMEFHEKAENDPNIDEKFDAVLKEQAQGDCVVTTWLGPWMVNADIKIKVQASPEIRAERIGKRDGMSYEDALKHIQDRDESNRKRYKKLYGIDIEDDGIFDAVLDSGKNSPQELLKITLDLIRRD